jgi:hypothetical protein
MVADCIVQSGARHDGVLPIGVTSKFPRDLPCLSSAGAVMEMIKG